MGSDTNNIHAERKKEHLESCLKRDFSHKALRTGFDHYRFIHNAAPEISFDEIDTSTIFLGKKLSLPLMISPLTGGLEKAALINQRIAEAAQFCRIAMGVGSQRVAISDQRLEESFKVREFAPDILFFANLGAVQLNAGYGLEECRKAVEMIDADGLMLHLNPLQEIFQPEGNHDFRGLLKKIRHIAQNLQKPLIVREVGFGVSEETAIKLQNAQVNAIDVGGAGGTSWIEIEQKRLKEENLKKLANDFLDWGIPTAESIIAVRKCCPALPVIASGGIRSGLDMAKSIALGADIAGIAAPALKMASKSTQHLIDYIMELQRGLKIAMFGTGSKSIKHLKDASILYQKNSSD